MVVCPGRLERFPVGVWTGTDGKHREGVEGSSLMPRRRGIWKEIPYLFLPARAFKYHGTHIYPRSSLANKKPRVGPYPAGLLGTSDMRPAAYPTALTR